MGLKFLYITNDPFKNETQEFVRILAINNIPFVGSSGGVGGNGNLFDQAGNGVATMLEIEGEVYTEATAYPYAFANSYQASQIMIVPPGWTFKNFGRAIAVQGSLEEVLMVH